MTWQTKKLDDACNVAYGTRVVNKRDGGSVFPVYGGGGATFSMDKYNREDCMVVARFAMSEKCTRFVSGKFFLNDSGLTVLPKSSKEILQEFLDYQLISLNDYIYSLARGSAQKNLDLPAFRKVKISYPKSLLEQRRIVKILDEVFEKTAKAKENAEKNLQNAKELFESSLQSIFTRRGEGWEEKTLGDVSQATQGVQIPKSEQSASPLKNYKRYLYISDFDHKKKLKYVPDIYPSKNVTKEDIIVANTGSAGKIFRGIDGILSNNLFKVTFLPEVVNRDFLFYFITSRLFKNHQQKIMRGTANPHMGHVNFKSTPICLPGVVEQKFVVKELDALSSETKKLEVIYKQKLADLEELKKSVLQKAFNGEL